MHVGIGLISHTQPGREILKLAEASERALPAKSYQYKTVHTCVHACPHAYGCGSHEAVVHSMAIAPVLRNTEQHSRNTLQQDENKSQRQQVLAVVGQPVPGPMDRPCIDACMHVLYRSARVHVCAHAHMHT